MHRRTTKHLIPAIKTATLIRYAHTSRPKKARKWIKNRQGGQSRDKISIFATDITSNHSRKLPPVQQLDTEIRNGLRFTPRVQIHPINTQMNMERGFDGRLINAIKIEFENLGEKIVLFVCTRETQVDKLIINNAPFFLFWCVCYLHF